MSTQAIPARERPFVAGSLSNTDTRFLQNREVPSPSGIFAGFSQREITEILSFARMRTFARAELLYSQGHPARNLIVLQSGTVKHTQVSSNGDEVLLRMTGPGEALNAQPCPGSGDHTCSARAMEECKVWVWEHGMLQDLLNRYPRLQMNITHLLTSRLQELEERFREIATEKVARRVALVLLRLVKQVGKSCCGGVQVCLSREELAQMTGTTLFTISRVLSRWAEMGLVVPKREVVVICDGTRLETVSENEI